MNQDICVSVLTPIYNVEKYLPQCLDSLIAQSIPGIEFICINDGSTDGSLDILKRYAEKDSRIRIIDKQNEGYGKSMNRGLDAARGEYIGIVESDDFIDGNAFEELYALAVEHDCDIVRANRYDHTDKADTYDEVLAGLPYDTVFRPLDQQDVFNPAPCIWANLYKRAFLRENGIRFLETPGASFQDTGFVYKSMIAAERILLTPKAYLHYRMDNENSSVKSNAKVFCVMDEFHSIDEFLEERPESQALFNNKYQALRYQAYEWNYNRLGWRGKEQFLERAAREFKLLQQQGKLDRNAFSFHAWDRLTRAITDWRALYEADAPCVSVIVPCYNCAKHIGDTLKSLRRQTLKDIEVIVVNDGSTDSSQKKIDRYCQKDSRFICVEQENAGLSAARNTGIEIAGGKYLSFIDGEDTVPKYALECLYGHAERVHADLAIGEIYQFSELEAEYFERTVRLAKKDDIDRYDFDLIWSFSVNNKLFVRRKVDDLGLRFDVGKFMEDGAFSMKYIFNSRKIVGCNTRVLNYRRNMFWDGSSITNSASSKHIRDLIDAYETVASSAIESLEADCQAATTEEDKLRYRLLKITYPQEVYTKLFSYLVDLQYRRIWLLDAEGERLLMESLHKYRPYLSQSAWKSLVAYHKDLPLTPSILDRQQLACHPQFSVVVTKAASPKCYRRFFNSLFHNACCPFEVLVPEERRNAVPAFFTSSPNVRFLSVSGGNAEYKNHAVSQALAPHVLFMEDAVYPDKNTLRKLLDATKNSQADFSAGCIVRIQKGKVIYTRSQYILFDEKSCSEYSPRSEFDVFDCSLNNKLIKKSAIESRSFVFSESSADDCARLYRDMTFKRYRTIPFITRRSDAKARSIDSLRYWKLHLLYIARVRTTQRMETVAEHDHRIKDKTKHVYRYLPAPVKMADPSKKMPKGNGAKNQVLFFSNRGMSENLQLVYDRLDSHIRKVVFTEPIPHSEAYKDEVRRAIADSRVIVLDDTCSYLREIKLAKGQKVVQLWHAFGAFKKFGVDNYWVSPAYERKAHKRYSAVMVSSESMRSVYAGAFGISESKVFAYGSPRTDRLLDSDIQLRNRLAFYGRHPQLKGKRVVLYAPTFRQNQGKQCMWNPGIDWDALSAALPEDVVFVVSEHPLERFDLLGGKTYPNIIKLSGESSNDVLSAASLLITDYSSIIFDAALLRVPIAFYCPDLDEYQTGFYFDFQTDLPGSLVQDSDKIPSVIDEATNAGPDGIDDAFFREKYLGACDGHSTERISRYIEALVR